MEREKLNNLYDLLCEFYGTYNLKDSVYNAIEEVLEEIGEYTKISDCWKLNK